MPGTKQIFATDPPKPLIGSLSRVVEHPHKVLEVAILNSWRILDSLVTKKNHNV